MKEFKDLNFLAHSLGNGVQARMDFENGYGVSVVQFVGTYGYEDGLYELAVMKDGSLCYDTPITDDVCGYLSEQDVSDIMQSVQKLPKP